jgi:hypothetical protein
VRDRAHELDQFAVIGKRQHDDSPASAIGAQLDVRAIGYLLHRQSNASASGAPGQAAALTLSSNEELFGRSSFALLFVLLLGVPALPLPTGGATHVFELVAILLALQLIRWLERCSRPRLRFLFGHRLSNIAFGTLVIAGSVAAFIAPPFSGLDTLPSLGVVLLSLGVLLEDALVVVVALVIGVAGVALEVLIGTAAIVRGIGGRRPPECLP